MREIEIKLKVASLDTIASTLESLGATISKPITQKDINFIYKDDVKWFEPLKSKWVYPRLRIQEGKPLILTVKKPLKNESDCREHELHIDDADELREIMDMFEYTEGITVIKTRRTCTFQDYTITLDEVENLGSFIEIERVVTDGDPEKIQDEMLEFAKKTFDIKSEALILKGYDILTYEKQNH
jgi:adenylate cyclase class 2